MDTTEKDASIMGLIDIADDPEFKDLVFAGRNYSRVSNNGLAVDYISTGNDILDAACGGVGTRRGIPKGKISIVSGKTKSFKSQQLLDTAISYLVDNPKGIVGFIDTENALSESYLQMFGAPNEIIDRIRILESPVTDGTVYIEHLYVTIMGFLAQCEEQELEPFVIVDSLSNMPTYSEEDSLRNLEGSKFDTVRNKVIKRITKSIPAHLDKTNGTLVLVSHLVQNMSSGGKSFTGVSYKEEVTEAVQYIASLSIRFERVYSSSGKPTDTGYAAGVSVVEEQPIKAKIPKTRKNPEVSVEYTIIPGFGCNRISDNLSFLRSGFGKMGSQVFAQEMSKVLEDLGLPQTYKTQGEIIAVLTKYGKESPQNFDRLVRLLRPLVFKVWDELLRRRRPFPFNKYDYLNSDSTTKTE